MTTKTLASPMSYYGATARAVDWANRPTSTGWKIAAWSGALLWIVLMFGVISLWYVCLLPFLWLVIPLRSHRRGQRKADQLAERQQALSEQQLAVSALQLQQQQLATARDLDAARKEIER